MGSTLAEDQKLECFNKFQNSNIQHSDIQHYDTQHNDIQHYDTQHNKNKM
jgi:hypothetical protein